MTNRLPSKSLIGRRVRVLHCPNCEDGSTGEVTAVNEQSGDVAIELEACGKNIVANWGSGDRWMVIPGTVPTHPVPIVSEAV